MSLQLCIVCLKEKESIKFETRKNGKLRNICEPCRNVRKRVSLWLDFFKHFGYKCSCCGETDIRFLTIDHVKNDGHLDDRNNIVVLRRAKEEGYPEDRYTCLCYNCNCGRARNKGVCPHKCMDKGDYMEQLTRANEALPNPVGGRPIIYTGEAEQRRAQAMAMFKLKQMSPEVLQEFIEKLEKAVPRPTE